MAQAKSLKGAYGFTVHKLKGGVFPPGFDYFEDPTFGLNGLRQLRDLGIPLATNTVVVNFEQLATNVRDPAVDVILLDTTFWGRHPALHQCGGVCETFQLGVAVRSSGELGIQLATMLHLGAALPNLTYAADAYYHQTSSLAARCPMWMV